MTDYTRGEVLGFIIAPLLVMIQPVWLPFVLSAALLTLCVLDILGVPLYRR